ncbi:MAG: hypothetical protein LC753_11120 [Acidobacteria bacterium]|nr:hypothetical protein [Acidobacteriota bacterium]MCA1650795.1 hypothetical protein [Acidobacteriota bacterium]
MATPATTATTAVESRDEYLRDLLGELTELAPRYKAGDKTALLDALFCLQFSVFRIEPSTDWFVSALRAAVLESLARESVNRTGNVRKRLEAMAEDEARYADVCAFVKQGATLNEAYKETVNYRFEVTGVRVSTQAIRQSYRRVKLDRAKYDDERVLSVKVAALMDRARRR